MYLFMKYILSIREMTNNQRRRLMSLSCPECESFNIQKRGYNKTKTKQRLECQDCGSWSSVDFIDESIVPDIRIGVCDIEMLPGKFYAWGQYDQYLSNTQMITDTCLLSWAGKYLNSSKIYSDILTPEESLDRDPKRIAQSAYNFISSCHIVIGHNWQGYDGKHLNTYFLEYAQPVKYLTIDTLQVARQNFKFTSNKLVEINKRLGIRNKIENDGFPLWIACSNGDQKALNTMLEYNIGDIVATETLYYKIRGFIPNHPNLARYNNITTKQCPNCLGVEFKVEGEYPVGKGMYESLRCKKCGSLHRYGKNLLLKSKIESLLKN